MGRTVEERGCGNRLAGAYATARFQVLARRWVVERTFSWLDHHRRMSKGYETLAETSEPFIYLAMSRLMVRRLTRS